MSSHKDDDEDEDDIPTIEFDDDETTELISSHASLVRLRPSDFDLAEAHVAESATAAELFGSPHASSHYGSSVYVKPNAYPRAAILHLMCAVIAMSCAYAGVNAIMALYINEWLAEGENYSTALSAAWMVIVQTVGPVAGVLTDRFSGNFLVQRIAYACWFIGSALTLMTAVPEVARFFDTSSRTAMSTTTVPMLTFSAVGAIITAVSIGIVSTLQPVFVGNQFDASQPRDLHRSFALFYFCYNVGMLLGEIVTPILRQYVSYEAAFMYTTCFAFAAMVAFNSGVRAYRSDPVETPTFDQYSFFASIRVDVYDSRRIIALFIVMPFYWALFIQQNNTWVYQARRMDCSLSSTISVPADSLPSLEDVFVLVFLAFSDRVLEPFLLGRGIVLRPLKKMGIGLVCCALSFLAAGVLQLSINSSPTNSLSVWWQLPQIALLGLSEAYTVTSGIAFGFEEAPPRARVGVAALWSLLAALGGLIVVGVSAADVSVAHSTYVFFAYAFAMLCCTLLFVCLAHQYRYTTLAHSMSYGAFH